jgi:hypothetical protein
LNMFYLSIYLRMFLCIHLSNIRPPHMHCIGLF